MDADFKAKLFLKRNISHTQSNTINTLLMHKNRFFQPILRQDKRHKSCQKTWECFNYEGIYRVLLGDGDILKYFSKSILTSIDHENDYILLIPANCQYHYLWYISLKKTLWSLFMEKVQLPRGCRTHYLETFYFKPLSLQEIIVLIWSTSEEWKTESTWESPTLHKKWSFPLRIS